MNEASENKHCPTWSTAGWLFLRDGHNFHSVSGHLLVFFWPDATSPRISQICPITPFPWLAFFRLAETRILLTHIRGDGYRGAFQGLGDPVCARHLLSFMDAWTEWNFTDLNGIKVLLKVFVRNRMVPGAFAGNQGFVCVHACVCVWEREIHLPTIIWRCWVWTKERRGNQPKLHFSKDVLILWVS